jgi:hypothetical protein
MKKTDKQKAESLRKKIVGMGRKAIRTHEAKIGETWGKARQAGLADRPALLEVIIQEQSEIDKIAGIVDPDDDA